MVQHHHDSWMFTWNDPGHERNQAHLVALREARVATERRFGAAEQSVLADLMRAARARFAHTRAAAAGGSTARYDACCA